MRKLMASLVVVMVLSIAYPVHAGGLTSNLLLSGAWCTFTYNQTTGYSNTTRVRFNKNGTYSTGGRAEGGTIGQYGSYAGQSESGSNGKWKVVKGELYLSEGNGQLGLVRTVIKKNSNGYPIIVADGVEYSQCR